METGNTTRSFVKLVQETGFGSIERFRLRGGQPIIDTDTEVCKDFKLSGIEPEVNAVIFEDYVKKPQVRAMLEKFSEVQDGLVERLDIRDGLPFKMTVRRNALT